MASSSNIDFSKLCAGCHLPSVVRCGNCWKEGRGKKVGYCSAAHQKMMRASHKPYCGLGEGKEQILFFQTPLLEIEFKHVAHKVTTGEYHDGHIKDVTYSSRQMLQRVMNKPGSDLSKLWSRYVASNETRQDWEIQHDTAIIRFILINCNKSETYIPTLLDEIYALTIPPLLSVDSHQCRKVSAAFYFALLDFNTVSEVTTRRFPIVMGPGKPGLVSLWLRVREEANIMKDNGFERFIPATFLEKDEIIRING